MSTISCSLVILSFAGALTGCAVMDAVGTLYNDVKINKAVQTGQIQIGATKEDIAQVTEYPVPFCKKTKTTAGGYYEMWDFASKPCGYNWNHSYVLIFKNNYLSEIRTVNNVSDMQF
jgi:hypothetical protein